MTPTLKVNTELDGSRMAQGMNRLGSSVKAWSSEIKGYIASAFSIGAITQLGRSTADYFASVGDSAGRLDIAVDKFQALVQVAKLAGKELGDVEKLLADISNAQVEAITNPTGQAATSFGRMGMSPGQLNTMTISDVLQRMGTALTGKNRTQTRDLTEGVVGTKQVGLAVELAPTFANLNAVTKHLLETQQIASASQVSQVKQAQDDLEVSIGRIKVTILPLVTSFINGLNILIDGLFSAAKALWAFASKAVMLEPEEGFAEASTILRGWAERVDTMVDQYNKRKGAGDLVIPSTETPPNIPPPKFDWSQFWEAYNKAIGNRIKEIIEGLTNENRSLSEAFDRNRNTIGSVPISNFLGRNIGVIDTIAKDQLTILKKIEMNTRDLRTANEIQDMFGLGF